MTFSGLLVSGILALHVIASDISSENPWPVFAGREKLQNFLLGILDGLKTIYQDETEMGVHPPFGAHLVPLYSDDLGGGFFTKETAAGLPSWTECSCW